MAEREPLAELEPCISSEGATPTQWAEARRVLRPGGVFAGTDSTDGLLLRLAHLGALTSRWIPPTSPGDSRGGLRRGCGGEGPRGASLQGVPLTATLPHWDALLKRAFWAMIAEEFAALAALVFVPVGTVFSPAGRAFLALFPASTRRSSSASFTGKEERSCEHGRATMRRPAISAQVSSRELS
jgi:hypothetical protein